MYVIGTAGHVDHGKSTLVRALTGIDPDRLKEEQARQMTIDLGFAYLPLLDGTTLSIIDVPGHRDFIENMLAGVGGIDAVIFVIAADEGVMPQTREHLAIIDLLSIQTGLIALTKIDLVPDPDWLDLVQHDIREIVSTTVLKDAPIIPISARQNIGLDALKTTLFDLLANRPPALDLGKPRLWVDRVFTVSGFGTVVTGTLLDGTLSLGQEVELLPSRRHARIRGLQSHNHNLDIAHPGTRVAINLAGLDKSEVHRGDLLTLLPSPISPTSLVDVRFRHLPASPRPLRHNAEVKLFIGSAESLGAVRVLEGDMLPAGSEGWLQLELRDALPLRKGDRFILRYPSPSETIGGGEVIDPQPNRRWRRNHAEVIARLEALARGAPEDLVMQALQNTISPRSLADLSAATGLDQVLISNILDTAIKTEAIIALTDDPLVVLSADNAHSLYERIVRSLTGFHKAEPLRVGMRSEVLRKQLDLSTSAFSLITGWLLSTNTIISLESGHLALPNHQPKPTKAQRTAIDALLAAFDAAPYSPLSVKEAIAAIGESVLTALIDNGVLRQVSAEVLFRADVYMEMVAAVRNLLEAEDRVNVKMLRDRFSTSRKYALAVLEHLDALGITKRDGDDHIIASGAWELIS